MELTEQQEKRMDEIGAELKRKFSLSIDEALKNKDIQGRTHSEILMISHMSMVMTEMAMLILRIEQIEKKLVSAN